jgi:hypothetical protein
MSGGPFRPRGGSFEPPPEPGADAALDDSGPERPRPGRPAPPPGTTSQATWLLGVVVVVVLVYITVNTLRTDAPGSRGVRAGAKLPPFAAPVADSTLQGDANVLVRRAQGVPAACQVRGPRVFNVCQAAERGPLVLGFMATRSQSCVDEVDVLDDLQARFRDVRFAVVAIRGNRGDVRRLIRRHGWTLPVAYDHDGAVSNAYAIAICPTITFARRGGIVTRTLLGRSSRAAIVRQVQRLR